MTFLTFISPYTYRTPEQQESVFSKFTELAEVPRYTPEDLPVLFRATQRKTSKTLVAASIACFAKTEGAFVDLLNKCRVKNTSIEGLEEGFHWKPGESIGNALKVWKEARSKGSATIGGRISADKKEAASKEACEKITERWSLPSQEWRTEALLDEAAISYNTAIKYLGKRPIAQYNYQAKLKRKANAKR